MTVDPNRLVTALTAAGWVEEGRRTGVYVRLRRPGSAMLLVPLDQSAPEYPELLKAVLTMLERTVEAGTAADRALNEAFCPCGGRRWMDDENWQPAPHERAQGRVPGAGLIPCGFCNEGGWDTPEGGQETMTP